MSTTKNNLKNDDSLARSNVFLEAMKVLETPEPIRISAAQAERGEPNRLTVKAMRDAREGKNLVRFQDAQEMFDALDR
jgi:hypothetical protein